MTIPPTRPEPFDPRDYPDPLDAAEQEQLRWRFFHPTDADAEPRRLGCSIVPWIAAALFWAAVVLVGSSIVATPRSVPIPTTSPPVVDVRPGSAGPSTSATGTSGLAPIGAPLVERDRVTPTQVSGAPQPRAEAPVPSPPGELGTAISSGTASWFRARGDQGAVPWWRPGQDPVLAVVSRFADGRTRSVTVWITGFCQCLVGTPRERTIDLSDGAFAQLAPLSVGLIEVTIELPTTRPLPATDGQR